MPKVEHLANVIVPGWVSRLFGCKPQPTAAELAEQAVAAREAERRAFLAKYDLAVDVGDTRLQNTTWQAAFAATNAALRVEVGR